ncbi:MAG: hypothetical protein GY732_21750 [Gammaproteobacteria bacterium]|nr:hypothetical protein [Gammaproteobacteria bacterium]
MLQYPKGTFRWDCLRGFSGLSLASVLFLLGSPGVFVSVVLAGLAGLFLVFLYNAWRRTGQSFELGEDHLQRKPDGRSIHWSDLSDLSLAYYTTRRDQQAGWLELTLIADAQTIRIDSRLTGFNDLLQRALRAAGDNHLELSPATCNNAGDLCGFYTGAEPGSIPGVING